MRIPTLGRLPIACFLGIVLLPLLFFPFLEGTHRTKPQIKGGDEPHYLVQINSWLDDGDLDLRNDYGAVLRGGLQAGWRFRGVALDHHIFWMVGDRRWGWSEAYEPTSVWPKDGLGIPVPTLRPGVDPLLADRPEHSSHPPGIAFLLSPLLWPFRGTRWVEILSLVCSTLSVMLGSLLFYRLGRRYVPDPIARLVAMGLLVFGTPVGPYGRTLFMEPFLLAFAVGAYLWVLEREEGWGAGLLLGVGALLKPNFLLLALPLTVYLFWKRRYRSTAGLVSVSAVFIGGVLGMNAVLYGSPWTASQSFTWGNPLSGLGGLLFSWTGGLFMLAPVGWLALWGWRRFLSQEGAEAWLLGSAFSLYLLMFASYSVWWGGWCYGPRYLVPVLPFFFMPLVYLKEEWGRSSRGRRWVIASVCVLSIGINLLAALGKYWNGNPLSILVGDMG